MNDIAADKVVNEIENSGIKKGNMPTKKLFVLGILGGMYVALSSQAALAVSYAIPNINVSRILYGLMFCAGVMFAFVLGAEIFVSNCTMMVAALSKKITLKQLLRNWIVVFIANFIGSLIIVAIINASGQLNNGAELLGAFTIKTAAYKSDMPYMSAFLLGILCNMLICLAVWMAAATPTVTGKIMATIFPITIFNIGGFENSVANMYFIPAGIMAANNSSYVEGAIKMGTSPESIAALGLSSLIQIIPVALGNIVGGGIFISAAYWLIHKSGYLD